MARIITVLEKINVSPRCHDIGIKRSRAGDTRPELGKKRVLRGGYALGAYDDPCSSGARQFEHDSIRRYLKAGAVLTDVQGV
jgi:hypothetical protein